MDVLEYWSPNMDWSQFKQGSLSDKAWQLLLEIVQLSHAHVYWNEAVRQIRISSPPRSVFPDESKYQRKKRRDKWERDIERAEGHMHRAAYLGAERIAELSYLVTPEDKGKPDWILYWALRLAVGHQPDHTRGRYKASALTNFDANAELTGDPANIAERWLDNAGFAGQVA